MESAQPSRLKPWLIAVLAVAAATLVRALLAPLIGHHLPFVAYYVAVAVVAFFGNPAAAVATTAAGAVLGKYFFGAAILSAPPVREDIAVGLFIISAVILAMVSDRVSKTRQRLQRVLAASQAKELDVQRERARLQEIIASIPGIVWEAWGEPDSARQRINYVSDYVQHMLGYSPSEWTSTPNFWLQIVPPEDREAAGRVAAERFKAGTEGEHEFRWMTKDGRICWVLARSTVIKDAAGQSVGMRGVTLDITDRKVAERRLALLADISTTGLIHPRFAEVAHYIARRTAEVLGDACVIGVLNGAKLERAAYAHRLTDAEGYLAALTDVPDLAAASPFVPRAPAETANHRRRRSADRHAAPDRRRGRRADGREIQSRDPACSARSSAAVRYSARWRSAARIARAMPTMRFDWSKRLPPGRRCCSRTPG